MKRSLRTLLPLLAASLLASLTLSASPAAAAPGDGTVTVRITTPAGVPATVRMAGLFGGSRQPVRVATKPAAGTTATVRLTAPPGLYGIVPQRVVVDGVAYVGRTNRPAIVPIPRIPFTVEVTYTAEDGASALHATSVAPTELGLEWSAPPGARFVLRRAVGDVPPATRIHGTDVRTTGTTALDTGLEAGRRYSYSLFTQYRNRWVGPLTITAGTTPPPGSTDAAFVAPATTLIAATTDVVSATTTGAGVDVVFRNGIRTLTPGAGVTLPVSEQLPGGFLGVVERIATDGRVVGLRAGGLSDAFDYYEIAVEDIASQPGEDAQPLAAPNALRAPGPEPDSTIPERAETAPTPDGLAEAAPDQLLTPFAAAAAPAAARAASCSSGGGSVSVDIDPSFRLGGRFASRMDKYRFLGVDVPVGASLDMELTATATGSTTVKAESGAECSLDLGKVTRLLSTSPIPISVVVTPTAEIAINGAVELENLGVQVTGGVRVQGTMSLKNGAAFDAEPILSATPLSPTITASGAVEVKLGGDIVVGPGAGTPNAGVIAGVRGEMYPLDASFGPFFSAGDARFNACLAAEAEFTAALSLVAKAWLGDWKFSESITLDALEGSFGYGGSPWDLPAGCSDLPGGGNPPDSLFGPGVTKLKESTTGGVEQVGYVPGFVPGAKSWVLSTGLISNAVGSPGFFASTNLGGPGDPGLTDLAGFPTYDAVRYEVSLVPTGSTLNVRYVFASEEYPEFVGSSFNDVMAVLVDGKNCAAVPGTSTPVAINTINAGSNSAFFVDNANGAPGYNTTMDGLTVPLTCSVPVTPGQAVTVQIVVADTSDHVYDSAVALVDGGIWTS